VTRFVLVPGAGGVAWYWHRVVSLLEEARHQAIAVDLPADDESAGLAKYTELTVTAIDGDASSIIVAQSLGGFTGAMAAARARVSGLTFVNAMIPLPGERLGEWGAAVGSTEARIAKAKRDGYSEEFDDATYFYHDVSEDKVGAKLARAQSEKVFDDRADFTAWPKIPIRLLASASDRLFPIELQQRIARDRLGIDAEVIPGGHLVALSHPAELVAALLRRPA